MSYEEFLVHMRDVLKEMNNYRKFAPRNMVTLVTIWWNFDVMFGRAAVQRLTGITSPHFL
jgi:hypothetical protein